MTAARLRCIALRTTLLIGVVLPFLAACAGPAGSAPEAESAAAHGEIVGAWTRFEDAWKRRDAAGSAALFASDAISMRPDAPSDEGRAAIERGFAELLASASMHEIAFTTRELAIHGGTAHELGTFDQRYRSTAGTHEQRGRYASVWKRQRDGSWRIQRFLFNYSPPLGEDTNGQGAR